MQLLFITQKIDQEDDDLAFTILWIKEFIKQGFDVSVICLEKRSFDGSFPVYSLGKERGSSVPMRIVRFLKYIFTLKYDYVFVHMNPEYFTLGGLWWVIRGVPTYLWYTHYTMTPHLFLAGLFSRKLFAATTQSLPQYNRDPKKVVLGHGIDTSFWGEIQELKRNSHNLLAVHRLSRSKRLELIIETLALLSKEYTLTVYGRVIDQKYFEELKKLIEKRNLADRVYFMGPVPMYELRAIYQRYRLMMNMASETIDKTMLEALFLGVYPVTTPRNAQAIGLKVYPKNESPQELARFIESGEWSAVSQSEGRVLVEQRHNLTLLVRKISLHIKNNT